jgi:hypothetical protein
MPVIPLFIPAGAEITTATTTGVTGTTPMEGTVPGTGMVGIMVANITTAATTLQLAFLYRASGSDSFLHSRLQLGL